MPRGFQGVRQASADVEARRSSGAGSGAGALWFRLNPGEEQIVRFLEQGDEIFWCWMHDVPVEGRQYGKDVACLNQDNDGTPCPGCENQIPRKFKGFINLIWFDGPIFQKDKDNKIVKGDGNKPIVIGTKPQVAVWGSGIRVFEELDEADTNYRGLKSRTFKVKRRGEGLNTKYSIAPADIDSGPQEMSAQEKELVDKKYDLNQFTKPGSYDEFLKELGEVPASGNGSDAPRTNPFMRRS